MVGGDSAREIDRHVDRLLREADALGRVPTPVDDLLAVRGPYIPEAADSPFDPTILAAAPSEIRQKMIALLPKVEAILDRTGRQVHVVASHIEGKWRFSVCHEVGHDILPRHRERYYLDGVEQLDPGVQSEREQEANYASIRLLLQPDVFAPMASDLRQEAATVKGLADGCDF
ncbi:MAG: hypothetical protein NVSMB65_04890 [Chloroflexota bacterium]